MRSTHDEVDMELVVTSRRDAADGVVVIGLGSADGSPLPAWGPGAHIDLHLTPDLTRQYSLCGDPDDSSEFRLGILLEQESRGGSRFIHDKLHPDVRLTARGPRNHFALVPSPNYVFIAGGIGITPIVPMLREAEARGAQWSLFYGGRTGASMAFVDELERYGDAVTVVPQDTNGMLDLPAILGTPLEDTAVYCCGPEPLLDAVQNQMASWPSDALHLERFAPKTIEAPISTETFDVELAKSGITVTIGPDQTILEAVIDAGIDAPSSCEEGTCGTCETVVIGGEPEHRDSLLSPAEQEANETMMICVSRSRCPRLVLDL